MSSHNKHPTDVEIARLYLYVFWSLQATVADSIPENLGKDRPQVFISPTGSNFMNKQRNTACMVTGAMMRWREVSRWWQLWPDQPPPDTTIHLAMKAVVTVSGPGGDSSTGNNQEMWENTNQGFDDGALLSLTCAASSELTLSPDHRSMKYNDFSSIVSSRNGLFPSRLNSWKVPLLSSPHLWQVACCLCNTTKSSSEVDFWIDNTDLKWLRPGQISLNPRELLTARLNGDFRF